MKRTSMRAMAGQMTLLPPVETGETMTSEARREVVVALAELLLQVVRARPLGEGERDDAPQDHA